MEWTGGTSWDPAADNLPKQDFRDLALGKGASRFTTAQARNHGNQNLQMEAKLCFIGHGLMENRSGLIVDTRLTRVSGHAERLAALDMIEPLAERAPAIMLGADRGYDAAGFVEELRTLNVRPHVAQNSRRRRSAIDGRTTRHPGYAMSQRIRRRIEEAFGWTPAAQELARSWPGHDGASRAAV